jgi:hypothetical protein
MRIAERRLVRRGKDLRRFPLRGGAESAFGVIRRLEKGGYAFRVFGPGMRADFSVPTRTDEAALFQRYIARGQHPRIGELLAHVLMRYAAGEEKGDGSTGKIFTEYVFHGASPFFPLMNYS